jgi:hypothetical protein
LTQGYCRRRNLRWRGRGRLGVTVGRFGGVVGAGLTIARENIDLNRARDSSRAFTRAAPLPFRPPMFRSDCAPSLRTGRLPFGRGAFPSDAAPSLPTRRVPFGRGAFPSDAAPSLRTRRVPFGRGAFPSDAARSRQILSETLDCAPFSAVGDKNRAEPATAVVQLGGAEGACGWCGMCASFRLSRMFAATMLWAVPRWFMCAGRRLMREDACSPSRRPGSRKGDREQKRGQSPYLSSTPARSAAAFGSSAAGTPVKGLAS